MSSAAFFIYVGGGVWTPVQICSQCVFTSGASPRLCSPQLRARNLAYPPLCGARSQRDLFAWQIKSPGQAVKAVSRFRKSNESGCHFLQFIWNFVRGQHEIDTARSLSAERHTTYFGSGVLCKGSSPRSLDLPASLGSVTVVARKNNTHRARAHECCK